MKGRGNPPFLFLTPQPSAMMTEKRMLTIIRGVLKRTYDNYEHIVPGQIVNMWYMNGLCFSTGKEMNQFNKFMSISKRLLTQYALQEVIYSQQPEETKGKVCWWPVMADMDTDLVYTPTPEAIVKCVLPRMQYLELLLLTPDSFYIENRVLKDFVNRFNKS